jgi:hypothetical protein
VVSLPLRLVLLLGALPLAMVNWRLAVVVLFALTLDFLVLVGWMMPMFGFWAELVLALPASILIGTLIVFGKKPSRTPLWVCVLALVALHLSPYVDGLLNDNAHATTFVQGLPRLGTLVLAVGLGIEVPFELRRLFTARRKDKSSLARRTTSGVDRAHSTGGSAERE